MSNKKLSVVLAAIFFIAPFIVNAQQSGDLAVNSITKAELRGHIYFLASDYLGGRVAISPGYDIASQYVAAEFASAGIEPLFTKEDGSKTFFQEVPFKKITFGDNISWNVKTTRGTSEFLNEKDFKILYSHTSKPATYDVVFAGYGIEEPGLDWNDFDGIDVEGKFLVCLQGSPMDKGKPVFPDELNSKYTDRGGFNAKISNLMSKKTAGILFIYDNGSDDSSWESVPSNFSNEQYLYQGPSSGQESMTIPSIFFINNNAARNLFGGQIIDPLAFSEKGLKKYRVFDLKNTTISTNFEILEEKMVSTRNVAGIVTGTDPDLKDEYIVVCAHLDHVKPVQGQVCNGADDNASGSSGVMEIAEAMALNPPRRSVILITFTGEEMGLRGSHFFVNSNVLQLEKIKFNVNLDMIGRSSKENEKTRDHYVVTARKYFDRIKSFVSDIDEESVRYPLIFDNDEDSPGGSDHQSFISAGIPAFFFFSGIHEDLHAPGDDAGKIDYDKAESISRLAYLVATRLANMDEVPDFIGKE